MLKKVAPSRVHTNTFANVPPSFLPPPDPSTTASMSEHVALYVLSGSSTKGETVLQHIRSSDFIDEINSGEGPREECGLYKLVQLVKPADPSVKFGSEQDVLDFHSRLVKGETKAKVDGQDATWNSNCVLIADKEQEDLVHVLQLTDGKVEQSLKAKARSSVEVVSDKVSLTCFMLSHYANRASIDGSSTGFQCLYRQYVDSRGKCGLLSSPFFTSHCSADPLPFCVSFL